jgi:butyrate kinase
MHSVLVINPGSASTKLALYEDETPAWKAIQSYSHEQLASFKSAMEQLEMRYEDVMDVIRGKELDVHTLSAVVSRGGPFKPLQSGTYRICRELLDDILAGRVQTEHISNIGVFIADRLTSHSDIPSFFVDPVSVDEMETLARFSGMSELERKSLVHALNVKAVARKVAARLGRNLNGCRFVIANLGSGFSICPMKKGRIVDVNNAAEEGPFSTERTGTLPVGSFAKLCYSGKYSYPEMKMKIFGGGGMVSYLGTNDAKAVEKRIAEGDGRSELVFKAMAYQIAKEIGAMATVLHGKIDGVILTGGLSHSKMLVKWVRERIAFLGPVFVLPGEFEMESLAAGALRVLKGREKAKSYGNSA